jgi:hypothetical protein
MVLKAGEGRLIAYRGCETVKMDFARRGRAYCRQRRETWQQAKQGEMNEDEILDMENETDRLVGAYG